MSETLESLDRRYRHAWNVRNTVAARPYNEHNVRVLALAERYLEHVTEERRIARSRAIRATMGVLKT